MSIRMSVVVLLFSKAAEEVEDNTAFDNDRRSVSGSGPPPPPPLPLGGIPPPPPLMSSGMDGQPKRACAVEPRVKLRPFFWSKVSAQTVKRYFVVCFQFDVQCHRLRHRFAQKAPPNKCKPETK